MSGSEKMLFRHRDHSKTGQGEMLGGTDIILGTSCLLTHLIITTTMRQTLLFLPILQMRKLRPKMVKTLNQVAK